MTAPNAKPRAGEHLAVPNQVLMREIGYVLDHPGSFGELGSYLKRIGAERDALAAQIGELVEALAELEDAAQFPEHVNDRYRQALIKARALLAKHGR